MSSEVVHIVGLTELGKQQTNLIIPREIDLRDVQSIGYHNKKKEVIGDISSDNLKKLYFEGEPNDYTSSIFQNQINVFTWSYVTSHYYEKYDCLIYMPDLSELDDKNLPDNIKEKYKVPNVQFYFINKHNIIYGEFYDNYENELITFMPTVSWFETTNVKWYTEKELVNEWNFETDIVVGETILYGKNI
jgi:hypothetical protein